MEIEELKYSLLGPEVSEVDLRHIAMNARVEMRRSAQGQSEFLVASAARFENTC